MDDILNALPILDSQGRSKHPLHDNWQTPTTSKIYGQKEIYGNQYNIGQVIVDTFTNIGALSDDLFQLAQINQINLLLLGPVFTSLRDQTRKDLVALARGRGAHLFGSFLVANKVKQAEEWLQNVEQHPDWLHILVHDEAHWGIAKRSKKGIDTLGEINKFLDRLADSISPEKCPQKPQLLVLCVSATLAVLTEGIEHMCDDYRVSWPSLKHDPKFALPNYLSIRELLFCPDPNIRQYAQWSAEIVADHVIDEYTEALQALLKKETCTNFAHPFLSHLWKFPGPALGAIRLRQIDECQRLESSLVNLLRQFKMESRLHIFNACTNHVADLQLKGPTLILMVEKLRMGDRVPGPIFFWDVRSRYNKAVNSLATFVQDIGRCAGHFKSPASILVGIPVFDPSKPDRRIVTRLDQLLTSRNGLTSMHPEYNGNGVYTRLKDHLVLLEAEPQVGKTGAILAFVDIIDRAIIAAQRMTFNQQRNAEDETRSHHRKLDTLSRVLYFNGKKGGYEEFKSQILDTFDHYQALLQQANDMWVQNESCPAQKAAQWIEKELRTLARFNHLKSELMIVDAGCGGCMLTKTLDQNLNHGSKLSHKPNVISIDIPQKLSQAMYPQKLSNLNFEYRSGDYHRVLETLANNSVAVLVFSLSISFTDNITELMNQVCRVLEPHGMLIIADNKQRFTPSFFQAIKSLGFDVEDKTTLNKTDFMILLLRRAKTEFESQNIKVELGPKYT